MCLRVLSRCHHVLLRSGTLHAHTVALAAALLALALQVHRVPCELVFGCDGLKSATRASLFGTGATVRKTAQPLAPD